GHGARFGFANGHRQLRLQHIEVAHVGFHGWLVKGGLLRGIGSAEQKGTQEAEGDGSKHCDFYCNGWGKGDGGIGKWVTVPGFPVYPVYPEALQGSDSIESHSTARPKDGTQSSREVGASHWSRPTWRLG